MSRTTRTARRLLRRLGFDVTPSRPKWPGDFRPEEIALCEEVQPYTMTSPEAIVTLASAVRHLTSREIPGAYVECGVWKGGSMMAVARTLLKLGRTDAHLYLFDTFEGMTPPTRHDVSRGGRPAQALLDEDTDHDGSLLWARAPLQTVKAAMGSVGYPGQHLHYVQGRVEETLPDAAPERIALLRLDTDWYESTRHELEHLWPRLQPGGILIIDDYGWWGGARKATDEFFAKVARPPF
ncbi:MAG: TylF/MycF/NovP-related O-methyltransferase, partial [Actinomycetota bacterium]